MCKRRRRRREGGRKGGSGGGCGVVNREGGGGTGMWLAEGRQLVETEADEDERRKYFNLLPW